MYWEGLGTADCDIFRGYCNFFEVIVTFSKVIVPFLDLIVTFAKKHICLTSDGLTHHSSPSIIFFLLEYKQYLKD